MKARPWSLLVVDADPEVLATFRRAGRKLPLKLRVARDAAEALRLAEDRTPNIVIANLALPGMDGLSLLERLHREWPAIVRVLHTNGPLPGKGRGADVPVLGRPCPEEALRGLLESIGAGLAKARPS